MTLRAPFLGLSVDSSGMLHHNSDGDGEYFISERQMAALIKFVKAASAVPAGAIPTNPLVSWLVGFEAGTRIGESTKGRRQETVCDSSPAEPDPTALDAVAADRDLVAAVRAYLAVPGHTLSGLNGAVWRAVGCADPQRDFTLALERAVRDVEQSFGLKSGRIVVGRYSPEEGVS